MLYNPKWEVQTPSMESFIAWLRTKNPIEEYDYYNCDGACLVGQYLNNIGLKWDGSSNNQPGCRFFMSEACKEMRRISIRHPRTFGGALKRALRQQA